MHQSVHRRTRFRPLRPISAARKNKKKLSLSVPCRAPVYAEHDELSRAMFLMKQIQRKVMASKDSACAWNGAITQSLPSVYATRSKPEISLASQSNCAAADPQLPVTFVSICGLRDWTVIPPTHPPGMGDAPETARTAAARPPVSPSTTNTTRSPSAGIIQHIMKEAEARGIHGGLRLENPRFDAGKVSVDIQAWAKIEVFGQKVTFDERFSQQIEPVRRRAVWINGWAHIEVCFLPPKQICATLYVCKWGFERHWNTCIDLPVAAPATLSDSGCGRK